MSEAPDLLDRIAAFLESEGHCAFGTLDAHGWPVVQTIRYRPAGLVIYLSTRPTADKALAVQRDPHCAYAIVGEAREGPLLKAIEVRGLASVLPPGEERDRALALHWDAFPQGRFPGGDENAVIRIAPTYAAFRDHSVGPLNVERVTF